MTKNKKWLALELNEELNTLLEKVSKQESRSKANVTRLAIKEYCKNKLEDGND